MELGEVASFENNSSIFAAIYGYRPPNQTRSVSSTDIGDTVTSTDTSETSESKQKELRNNTAVRIRAGQKGDLEAAFTLHKSCFTMPDR